MKRKKYCIKCIETIFKILLNLIQETVEIFLKILFSDLIYLICLVNCFIYQMDTRIGLEALQFRPKMLSYIGFNTHISNLNTRLFVESLQRSFVDRKPIPKIMSSFGSSHKPIYFRFVLLLFISSVFISQRHSGDRRRSRKSRSDLVL